MSRSLILLHKNLVIAAQILTEPLPISSSAHVWITDFFWKKSNPLALDVATEHLMDLLFFPTLIALIFFFRHHVIHLIKTIFTSHKQSQISSHYMRWWMIMLRLAGYVAASTFIFAAVFLVIKNLEKILNIYTKDDWFVPFWGLAFTMIFQASLFFAPNTQASESSLNLGKACIIGALQGLAALPGVSRLSTTLVTARWLNIPPHRAFEFSTLLQIIIFVGNFVKNTIVARQPGQLFSLQPYIPLLSEASISSIAVIIGCTILSYAGLLLTNKLNAEKKLWKIAPYMLIPMSLLIFFH